MQNMRTIRYCFILFLSVLVSCKDQTDKLNDNCPLIPKPLSLDMQPGEFTFGDSVVIELKTDDEEIKRKTSAMYQYYSHDEEKQYDVVGIKISLVK